MTEQTPTPSTATESVLGSRSEHSSGAATAHPLPLVRHHREGGDEEALFELDSKPAQPVFATEWAVQREMGLVLNFREDEEEARARLEKGDALLQRTVLVGPWSVTS